jgi:preprotein translocase subunit SecB
MSDSNFNDGDLNDDLGDDFDEDFTPPQIQIRAQYIKDFSFENPNAPQSILEQTEGPDITVGINVAAEALSDEDFEVVINLTVDASRGEEKAFLIELFYGGVFTIKDAPAEILEPLCMIECPRYLFPFVRQIVADATKDSGMPPLLLEPMDFGTLYQSAQTEAGNA